MSRALAVIVLLLAAGDALAEGEKIVAIEVVENSKTNDETVILIADVSVGQYFTFALADRIKVDLVSSGLFKDVNVFSAPMPEKGGVKLVIVAKDKHSWVIAPTVYLQPGNTGIGCGFGENNLFGKNKKLLLYGQLATSDSLFIAGLRDPALGGSPFYLQLDTFLRHERVTEFDSRDDFLGQPEPERISVMNYLNSGTTLGLNIWKGMAIDGRLRAARVFYEEPEWAEEAIAREPATHQGVPPAPDKDGWDVSTEVRLTRDKRANWYGVTTGSVFGLSYERALPGLGSDWEYWYFGARLQLAYKFFARHNLQLKLFGGYGDNMPFQQEYSSGGTGLRGYQNRQFRGDTKGSFTFEYSVPFFTIGSFAFRGLVFYDTAYTAFNNTEDNASRNYLIGQTENELSKWRNGVGAGFRIYVRSVVIPLLGLDWGYGIEAGDYHIYFAVGLTEL
jgi:outer membrane protein insertion porin family